MTDLDDALSLTPEGPDSSTAMLTHGWTIRPAVNGGLLLALLGRALQDRFAGSGHPDPLAISAYYLSAAVPGPAALHTQTVRSGRTLSTGQASLSQSGSSGEVERVRALASYGDLDAFAGEVRTSATPPEMPPPEQCLGADTAPEQFVAQVPLLGRLDLRLDPATVGWAVGEPSHRGLIQGWLRMADGREPDVLALLFALDALPPVTFDLGHAGWTPTLELSAHVRARPAPGWLRVSISTRNVAGGLLEEDAEVWDSADRLVAQSRQLAMLPVCAMDSTWGTCLRREP